MTLHTDPISHSLLDNWQRNFPLVSHPFQVIASTIGITEQDVLKRLNQLKQKGAITRLGATCAPNTVAASTLAAVAAPDFEVSKVAEIINAEEGVNHSYLRENDWNIWFVATGPDRAHVTQTLNRISKRTGLRVLDLRLEQPFNIDLGFSLDGAGGVPTPCADIRSDKIIEGDRAIMQAMSQGLHLCARPFADMAGRLGVGESFVLDRIKALSDAGLFTRVGIIVRHRALGWRSNAMVVWKIPGEGINAAGAALARLPGVTLCYQRRAEPDVWPFTLYNMIHARSRSEAEAVLTRARALPELAGVEHKVLFSLQCFKQKGALIKPALEKGAAA
ncbi:MAG: Lrp/AsnC family transcriptional regulator [Rhodobacteraceae bacterium]|nr:Lrp/AsnC family transcriptional regulator [Paracoccaceae bacterium]